MRIGGGRRGYADELVGVAVEELPEAVFSIAVAARRITSGCVNGCWWFGWVVTRERDEIELTHFALVDRWPLGHTHYLFLSSVNENMTDISFLMENILSMEHVFSWLSV
jgi:hypothetical protein